MADIDIKGMLEKHGLTPFYCTRDSSGMEVDSLPDGDSFVSVAAILPLLALYDAVMGAPVVEIGGADGLSCFLRERGKKSLPSMQGQTVRLVPDCGSGE